MLIRTVDLLTESAQVVELYQMCFGEPPWNERYEREELDREFREIVSWEQSIFLVACEVSVPQQIVAGAIAFPLYCKQEVLDVVDSREQHSLYMAELFVAPSKRGMGIGRLLTQARMQYGWQSGFRRAVVRTSIQQNIIQDLYTNVYGFTHVCSQTGVFTQWIDGVASEVADTRVILAGDIPQP